jgi:hypothetical protein
MIVFLVPAGRNRFELYSEAPEGPPPAPSESDGAIKRRLHAVSVRWHELVDAARRGTGAGRLGRWRDTVVCRLAETIAEQRTLWSLADLTTASLHHPSTIEEDRARKILSDALSRARRHHGWWFVIDLVVFVGSAVLAIVPGPNLVAYYFMFRFLGHAQSWRGARHGADRITWSLEPDASLTELASLVDVPRDARAPRVAAIAERLNLPRLTDFFDRVAVPSA